MKALTVRVLKLNRLHKLDYTCMRKTTQLCHSNDVAPSFVCVSLSFLRVVRKKKNERESNTQKKKATDKKKQKKKQTNKKRTKATSKKSASRVSSPSRTRGLTTIDTLGAVQEQTHSRKVP